MVIVVVPIVGEVADGFLGLAHGREWMHKPTVLPVTDDGHVGKRFLDDEQAQLLAVQF